MLSLKYFQAALQMLIFQNETNIFVDDSPSIAENNIAVNNFSKQIPKENLEKWAFS